MQIEFKRQEIEYRKTFQKIAERAFRKNVLKENCNNANKRTLKNRLKKLEKEFTRNLKDIK